MKRIYSQQPVLPTVLSAAPAVPMGLASNTASLYGQRLGSALGVSGAGLAPNTVSLAPGSQPSVLSALPRR